MTDMINPLADPGSDPPHEGKQPAPVVTPASLRAHADWMRGQGEDRSADLLRTHAARLEAESARDEEAEQLAKVYWAQYMADDTERDRYRFDRLAGDTQWVVKAGIRAVLDRLAADGRLLPEGGTANVVDLHHNHAFGNDSEDCQACRQRSAMAPPAASVPEGGTVLLDDCPAEDDSYGPDFAIPCILVAGHSGDHLASSGDRIAYRWAATPPAVSVPDSTHPYFVWEQGYMASLEDAQGGADGSPDHPFTSNPYSLGEPVPAASFSTGLVAAGKRAADIPVDTPDGTPEKPWPTWQDVPDDTPFWSRDHREWNSWWWIKRAGELRQADSCGEAIHLGPTGFMNGFAPFVRVDGDKKEDKA